MNLASIQPALALIQAPNQAPGLRGITYWATYPDILRVGTAPGPADRTRFHQLAAMAYAWMPRVLRLDPIYWDNAVVAMIDAQTVTPATLNIQNIVPAIASCLHSVVGASKVLHFLNPEVFPIWDSKIEAFRTLTLERAGQAGHVVPGLDSVHTYAAYVRDVHAISQDPEFLEFYTNFEAAYQARLATHGVVPYRVSMVRAIESAAFELAP